MMASDSDNVFLIQYELDRGPHQPSEVYVGLQMGAETYALDPQRVPSLDSLLGYRSVDEFMPMLLASKGQRLNLEHPGALDQPIRLWTPVGNQEVWAAGVTYKRSEQAREEESNNSNLYTRVYSATRPELFFKAIGPDVSGHGYPVGIRFDATWSVPEPELVVVLNSRNQVVGFTIGNDMTARDIEGENALYLPQAKVYERSCAIGPRIWLQPGRAEWPDLTIKMTVERQGRAIFEGETSTQNISRSLRQLRDYLGRCKHFLWGVFLFSGTGILPPDDFALGAGDVVRVRIDPIGELVNTVQVVGAKRATGTV